MVHQGPSRHESRYALLFREPINSDSRRAEFESSVLEVEVRWDRVHPWFQAPGVFREIARGARLDGEAHVHDLDGMALPGRDVHEPAFGQEVDPLPARQRVFVDEFADATLPLRVTLEVGL